MIKIELYFLITAIAPTNWPILSKRLLLLLIWRVEGKWKISSIVDNKFCNTYLPT